MSQAPRARPRGPWNLFVAFSRLALQGFGGVLPIAQRELGERDRWLTREQFVELLSVAQVLPGWVFNVAMIFHAEEAVLAAGFLFTVHFFNNHWRPENFPLDIMMFTGTMPLEKFKHEHPLEYKRLVESGELKRYLVDAPSRPMTLGSKILGFTLMAIGLILLSFILVGFSRHLLAG